MMTKSHILVCIKKQNLVYLTKIAKCPTNDFSVNYIQLFIYLVHILIFVS